MDELLRFTVEVDRPPTGWGELQEVTAGARRVAAEMRREGRHVRLLRAVFVPEDDSCFFLYEAASAAAVREASRRAELGARSPQKTIKERNR